jgi:SAM-dependent methyltransferase
MSSQAILLSDNLAADTDRPYQAVPQRGDTRDGEEMYQSSEHMLRLPRWEDVVCDLCGADDPVLFLEKDEYHYVRCRRCGLVYVTPRLRNHPQQQDRCYQLAMEASSEAVVELDRNSRRMKSLTRAARSYFPYKRKGILLDVGCGFGAFLEAAKSIGWKACGVEVASLPASIAARCHDVFHGYLSDAPYEPNSFDVVRLNNVIEHAPSPRALVRDIERVLRPGGLLYISTPNVDSFGLASQRARWNYVGGQDHIYLLGVKTLTRLLGTEGFEVIRVNTRGIQLTHKDLNLQTLSKRAVRSAERVLNAAVRRTLGGQRLRVWAEKRPSAGKDAPRQEVESLLARAS